MQQVYKHTLNSQHMSICIIFMDMVLCYLSSLDAKKRIDSCHRPCYHSSSPHPASRTLLFAQKLELEDSVVHLPANSGLLLIEYLLELCPVCLSHITNHGVELTVFIGIPIIPTKLFLIFCPLYLLLILHLNALIIISYTSPNNLFLLRLTSCNTHSSSYVPLKLNFLTFYFEDS